MKTLLTLLLASVAAFGAGTVTPLGPTKLGNSETQVLQIDWTGDASTGSVPVYTIAGLRDPQYQGMVIVGVELAPLTPAPTTLYDVTITDAYGVDILGGLGANLSATTGVYVPIAGNVQPLTGALTLTLTNNSVASAQGRILVYLAKTSLTLATVNNAPGTCGDATHVCQVTVNRKGLTTSTTEVAISGGGSGITALTGDVSATGPGSAAATLATVNANTGACGDSTHVCQVTLNAKGLATAATAVAISGAGITAGFGLTLTGSEMAADPAVVATQTADNTFTGRQDATGASSTAPAKAGTSLPASCVVGDLYVKTNATATNVLYACTATNTWTAQGGAGTKPNDIYRTIAVSCGNGASGSVVPLWFNPVTTGSGSQCNDSGEGHAYVDNGGSAKVIIPYRLPSDFDGTTLNISLVTRNGETATETLSIETSCLASGGDWDSATFNTAQTWTQAYTSGQTTYTSKNSLTLTGCTAGDMMYLRFKSTAGSNFLLIMEATLEAGRA